MKSFRETSPDHLCDWMIKSAQVQRTQWGRVLVLPRLDNSEATVLDFGANESLSVFGRALFYLHCEYLGLSDKDEQDRALRELEASVRRVG